MRKPKITGAAVTRKNANTAGPMRGMTIQRRTAANITNASQMVGSGNGLRPSISIRSPNPISADGHTIRSKNNYRENPLEDDCRSSSLLIDNIIVIIISKI